MNEKQLQLNKLVQENMKHRQRKEKSFFSFSIIKISAKSLLIG